MPLWNPWKRGSKGQSTTPNGSEEHIKGIDRMVELVARSPKRTPTEEIGKRYAEANAGVNAAAHAMGLKTHYDLLQDTRRRTHDGHAAMAKAAGFDVDPLHRPGEVEDDGITVTGDNYTYHEHHVERSGWGLVFGIASAILAAALVGVGTWAILNRPQPTEPPPLQGNLTGDLELVQ